MKKIEKYKTPPKRAFRAMELGVSPGVAVGDRVKVVAGFQSRWWDPDGWAIIPLFVKARITRVKAV